MNNHLKQTMKVDGNASGTDYSNAHELLLAILLEQFPNNNQWVEQFSQDCNLQTVQLGDELFNSNLIEHSEKGTQLPPYCSNLYIVCQGRIRLLSMDTVQNQDVSVALLEAGEFFGADTQCWVSEACLADISPLPYRAVAANPALVAVMPLARLTHWLKQLPQLQTYLHHSALIRQQMIFFKGMTELRSQASHEIKRLLPCLREVQLPVGSVLAQATPTADGRFWLYRGQVHSQDTSLHPAPGIGDAWGYPDPVPVDWIAATDLSIYKLAIDQWPIAQTLIPELDRQLSQTGQKLPARSRPPAELVPPATHRLPPQKLLLPSEPTAVDFAKPLPRRPWGHRWSTYPFIQQQSSSDCGAACLAMVAQYWGKRFSLNMLRNLAGVGRSGASLKGLASAAESLGFLARPVRSSFNRLAEQSAPWIAHWQGDHYVVVYRIQRNRIIIADPALGRRSLPIADFQANWTGYALLLTPTALLNAAPSSQLSLGRFWSALLPYRARLLPILLASVLLQLLGIITPLFTQIILDQVVVHKSLLALQVFIIGLLIAGFWRIGLVTIRQYLLDFFSNQVDLTLISGFINHTLNLPLQFFALRQVGDIVTRVQENRKVQLFMTRQALTTMLDTVMAVVYVGLMLHYNWQLTLLVLAMLPPIIILTVIASPFLRQVSRQIFHEAAQQNAALVEMLTGIGTVKAAAAERDVRWQWEDYLTGQLNAQFRGQKLAIGLQGISQFISILGSTALLWYGATLVIQDQLSIGQLVAFNMMIGNVIGPVLSLVGLWDELQEVMVSVERLEDIFSTPPEESPDKPLLVLPPIQGEVCFENVTFRYTLEDDRNVLQNISFVTHPGETIAIVGRSGSGKTTLINLLQGLYHPTSGRVVIDGHDLRHVSPQSLRHQLGVVPQECFLFSGTILDNIALFRPEYRLETVIEAAKLAEAHSFIQSLPLGYSTKVGERGSTLSGGQRQRIAIARAILSDPRILILDEATSSLDTEAERRFQMNLHRLRRDRTTFIIAHRLATVRNADCILVLDRGLVVEQGTHDQLMAKHGLYAQLAQQQLDL